MSTLPPPLTHAKKSGEPYVRRDEVSGEIAKVLETDISTWPSTKLRSETLVHLLRVLWKRGGEESHLGPLVERLARHIARIVKDNARGFDAATTEDIIEKVGDDIVDLIFTECPTRQSEFLEVSFRVAVKRRTLNQVEKRQNRVREYLLTQKALEIKPLESIADDGPTPEECVSEAELRELTPKLIRESLEAISDPRHREAVVLRYLQGWPVTDKNPEIPTLCKHFKTSARQIQNWMKDAFDEMRAAVGEEI